MKSLNEDANEAEGEVKVYFEDDGRFCFFSDITSTESEAINLSDDLHAQFSNRITFIINHIRQAQIYSLMALSQTFPSREADAVARQVHDKIAGLNWASTLECNGNIVSAHVEKDQCDFLFFFLYDSKYG